MQRTGHYGISLLCYAPVGFVLVVLGQDALAVFGGVGVLALSSVPDLDYWIPGVSHRGITHTIPFAIGVGIAFAVAVVALSLQASDPLPARSLAVNVAFAFGIGTFGILAHLVGDVLTPMGVALLWPLSDRRFTVSLTPAANAFWNYVFFVTGVVVTAILTVIAFRVA